MDHNCVKNCYDYRNYWGVGSVVVAGDFVVGFAVYSVDYEGERVAGLKCYFGDYRIVGAVADSNIVIVVDSDKMGD